MKPQEVAALSGLLEKEQEEHTGNQLVATLSVPAIN